MPGVHQGTLHAAGYSRHQESSGDALVPPFNKARALCDHGMAVNRFGGMYKNGAAYGMSKKMEILCAYKELKRKVDPDPGQQKAVSWLALAKKVGVDDKYAKKVVIKYLTEQSIRDPWKIKRLQPCGVGTRSFTWPMVMHLLHLRNVLPTRTLALDSYVIEIQKKFGRTVSSKTVSSMFL